MLVILAIVAGCTPQEEIVQPPPPPGSPAAAAQRMQEVDKKLDKKAWEQYRQDKAHNDRQATPRATISQHSLDLVRVESPMGAMDKNELKAILGSPSLVQGVNEVDRSKHSILNSPNDVAEIYTYRGKGGFELYVYMNSMARTIAKGAYLPPGYVAPPRRQGAKPENSQPQNPKVSRQAPEQQRDDLADHLIVYKLDNDMRYHHESCSLVGGNTNGLLSGTLSEAVASNLRSCANCEPAVKNDLGALMQ